MAQFFLGWRRKFGCATLALAIAFMAAWVRSLTIYDFWMVNLFKFVVVVISSKSVGLALYVIRPAESCVVGTEDKWHSSWPNDSDDARFYEMLWNVNTNKFHCATVPHWSIVVPLTLAAAFLLFGNARVAKPKR